MVKITLMSFDLNHVRHRSAPVPLVLFYSPSLGSCCWCF